MSRSGCTTAGWQSRLMVSRAVRRASNASKVSSRMLLRILRRHGERLPELLPSGQRVRTLADWAERESIVVTTVCDGRRPSALTLVQFDWEEQ